MLNFVISLISIQLLVDPLAEWLSRLGRIKRNLLVAFIQGAGAWLMLWDWHSWPVFLLAGLARLVIEPVALRRDTLPRFLLVQAAHMLALTVVARVWLILNVYQGVPIVGYRWLVLAAGFVTTVWSAGIPIGLMTQRLIEQNQLQLRGLIGGGQLIGRLERAFIFIFMFIGQPVGIGFLVAAKSVLRFENSKDQKYAEYVLIGTLISFLLAVLISKVSFWAASRTM